MEKFIAPVNLPAAKSIEPCKACDAEVRVLGLVDFAKWCTRDLSQTPKTGVQIPYYGCRNCGLVFTTAFDHFTQEQWRTYVYNERYGEVDPDYQGTRPRNYAGLIVSNLPEAKSLRVIDYGGGSGIFADTLAAQGWADVQTYDPFVSRFSSRPQHAADLVTAIEVLEHSPDPRATFREIASMMHESSILLATTLLAPFPLDERILDWWYVAPRNGHVTIHSRSSLQRLAAELGWRMSSSGDNIHAFWRQRPPWAARMIPL